MYIPPAYTAYVGGGSMRRYFGRRRAFGRHRRRGSSARRALFCAVLILILTFTVGYAERRLPSLYDEAVLVALNRFANEKLSETVPEYLSEIKAQYDDRLVLQDTYQLNQLKTTLINRLQKKLSGKTAVWIPFGNLTDLSLLHGHGMKIPLVFFVTGSAEIDFTAELSSAGINRTKYSVIMEITVDVSSLSVRIPASVSVKSRYPIYEGVLEGDIPQYSTMIR